MATGQDWHRWEVELTVEAYLSMLEFQRSHIPFVKIQIERELSRKLEGRSKGSVSRKFMNISHAIHELGIPSVSGYKPLRNIQGMIREVLVERLATAHSLVTALNSELEHDVPRGSVGAILEVLEEAPDREERSPYSRTAHESGRTLVLGRDWLALDQLKRSLGLGGEHLVLEFEDARLRDAGRADLANRIEHVSQTKGDSVGYDVHSFDTSGKDRFIEVKTTSFGKYTPFFATAHEVRQSVDLAEFFHLYRVFDFRRSPRLFQLPGSLWETCAMEPSVFKADPGNRVVAR